MQPPSDTCRLQVSRQKARWAGSWGCQVSRSQTQSPGAGTFLPRHERLHVTPWEGTFCYRDGPSCLLPIELLPRFFTSPSPFLQPTQTSRSSSWGMRPAQSTFLLKNVSEKRHQSSRWASGRIAGTQTEKCLHETSDLNSTVTFTENILTILYLCSFCRVSKQTKSH